MELNEIPLKGDKKERKRKQGMSISTLYLSLPSLFLASIGRRVEKVDKKIDDGRQKPPKINGSHVTPVEGTRAVN